MSWQICRSKVCAMIVSAVCSVGSLWLSLQLTTVALLILPCEGVPLSSFYSYGTTVGDTSLGQNDDNSSDLIALSTAFPYFGSSQTTAYVSNRVIPIAYWLSAVPIMLCDRHNYRRLSA